MKKILILGSTGSIGVNSLNVIREFKEQFKVEALTTNTNIGLLKQQIEEFNPKCVVVRDEVSAAKLQGQIKNDVKVYSGHQGLVDIAKDADYDIVISSLVGFAGLAPTIESIKRGKRIALANKETLVAAGELVIGLCEKYKSEIVPVDSEHSAIFQCLVGENVKNVKKIILTASGGPFLHKSIEELKHVTIQEALNHPNWSMGSKITIDSATMMNKGLEVIEAFWLFRIPKEKLEVIVHPQSIIHSMVEYNDGSIKAQLSSPDMKIPIQYALSYPDRLESSFVQTNFIKVGKLTFFAPDLGKNKCLRLAYQALEQGGSSSCILNAANEVAVNKYLAGQISFIGIAEMIEDALNTIKNHIKPELGTIYEIDFKTRNYLLGKYN
ncbi:MAG: 1-deoxy-D-xylulose-5-phosphate reductoisomerase [bacterium]